MRLDVTSHTVRRSLGLQWIAANLFGFAFGGLLFGVVQGVRMQPYFEAVTSVREAVRIEAVNTGEALALFGALVGAAQWVVLRRTPVARWWVPATALGWGLSGVVVGVDSGLALGAMSSVGPHRGPVVTAAAAIASAVMVGLLLGGFQWLDLRQYADRAWRWPLAVVIGFTLGFRPLRSSFAGGWSTSCTSSRPRTFRPRRRSPWLEPSSASPSEWSLRQSWRRSSVTGDAAQWRDDVVSARVRRDSTAAAGRRL